MAKERKKLLSKGNPLIIPFGKPARINNFKLWRGNYVLASGKEKTMVECIHISTLDGSWMTRIPSTSQMFSTICNGYATVDENFRDQFLGMIFSNIYNMSNIPSEALHDAFFFLQEMMSFPYMMLSEKEMEKRMKENMKKLGTDKAKAKEHISKMMEYRRGLYELIERKKADYIDTYEKQQAERWAKEEDSLKQLEQDEIAEEALKVLNNGDS